MKFNFSAGYSRLISLKFTDNFLIILFIILIISDLNAGSFSKKIDFVFNAAADARLNNITVEKVSVAGSFNGWNKDSNMLVKGTDGIFRAAIKILEGKHLYKFVVNDYLWLEDINSIPDLLEDDGMGKGNRNSILIVKETGADYGSVLKDKINNAAIKHSVDSKFCEIIKPGVLKIKIRVLKDDADSIKILYCGGTEFNKISARTKKMEKKETVDGFDFYESEIEADFHSKVKITSEQLQYVSYRFEIMKNKNALIFPNADWVFTAFNGFITEVPEWAKGAIWYQIFPERFRNGDKSNDPRVEDIDNKNIDGWKIREWGSDWYAADDWENKNFKSVFQSIFSRRYGGDMQGIIDKLDYIKSLGITAIYLNPMFRSLSLHKYDGSCFHHIDEHFGPDPIGDKKRIEEANETEDPSTWIWTEADKQFLKLVDEIHKRGMKVIIDGVFNHSGRAFFAFQDMIKNGKNSRYKNWYNGVKWNSKKPDGFDYTGWFGHKSLPEFNRDEKGVFPDYRDYVFNITKRWMQPAGKKEKGIDGWRLDVAYCLPHSFWKDWRRVVKSLNSQAYITAEIIELAPDFMVGDEFDALMNYQFAMSAVEFFVDKKNKISASELAKRLKVVEDAYPKEFFLIMQNLIGSHDTPRLRSFVVNPDLKYRDFGYMFNNSKVENNTGYRIDRGGNDAVETHKLLALFQMTYPGAPMIYYGDEVGMTGANDPDCRKPMLWEDLKFDDETVNPHKKQTRPAEKNIIDTDLLDFYRKICRIHNSNSALVNGDYNVIITDDKNDIFGFTRKNKDQTIVIIFNNSEQEQAVEFDLSGKYKDLLSGESFSVNENGKLKIKICRKNAMILLKEKK